MGAFILCCMCASMGASTQHVCEHRRAASKSQVLYIHHVGSGIHSGHQVEGQVPLPDEPSFQILKP